LKLIELQDSAYPYHDWNERVASECYAPNATSRILDGEQRIIQLVNNYSRISFNFGPTLLSWIEQKAPRLMTHYAKRTPSSRERYSGHGSAVAQAYNHMIMPLANCRDKITQVKWGIRDFEYPLGRLPEECGCRKPRVDTETAGCAGREWDQNSQSLRLVRPSAFVNAAAVRGKMSAEIALTPAVLI